MEFTSRFIPNKVFDPYTPTELALKRVTLDNRDWVRNINIIIGNQTGRHIHRERLDLHFRQYVNKKFPLEKVDVNDFENYLLQQELNSRPPPVYSEDMKLWHSHHPHGQKGYAYPTMDHREEPNTFDFLTYRGQQR